MMKNIVLDTNCHFEVLKQVSFPHVSLIGINDFVRLLLDERH